MLAFAVWFSFLTLKFFIRNLCLYLCIDLKYFIYIYWVYMCGSIIDIKGFKIISFFTLYFYLFCFEFPHILHTYFTCFSSRSYMIHCVGVFLHFFFHICFTVWINFCCCLITCILTSGFFFSVLFPWLYFFLYNFAPIHYTQRYHYQSRKLINSYNKN